MIFENIGKSGYNANHVYCRRPGPCHLLNSRYREPTHDSKQETNYTSFVDPFSYLCFMSDMLSCLFLAALW